MLADLFAWFTEMENTKPFALVMFFIAFVGILVYVFSSRKRSERLESYKHIPLDDEDDQTDRTESKDKHDDMSDK